MKINWRIIAEILIIMLGGIILSVGDYMCNMPIGLEWWPAWLENPWTICFALGGTIMCIPWMMRVVLGEEGA